MQKICKLTVKDRPRCVAKLCTPEGGEKTAEKAEKPADQGDEEEKGDKPEEKVAA